jgi:transcriptional regulator with XRE-family HTH domain
MNDLTAYRREAIIQRITVTRRAYGWSQSELSRRLGITPQAWGHYEHCRSNIPYEIASKICDLTGVSLDWIYRGVEILLPKIVADHLANLRESAPQRRRA